MGQFTILDTEIVQEEDLGVNFFLDEQSLGKFRAEETCKYLQELNPDVQGHFLSEPVETFISRADSLTPYSHILVVSPIDPDILTIISEHAKSTHKPIFYIHCVGFYAHFSIYLPPTFPIVDTHPDPTSTTDLRLVKPWTALGDFAAEKSSGLDEMSGHDHGHVPYLVLLLHYLEEWKKSHDGKVPSAYREKTEFRNLVSQGMRTKNAEGGEENYEEAISAVLKSLNEPTASSGVREVFAADECQNLTKESANFWIIAHAISKFYETSKVLPLPGAIPDMKAQSADYIALQNVYKSKARGDVQSVLAGVRSLEKQLGRSTKIPESEVEAFCKGASHIKLIRGRPLHIVKPTEKYAGLTWGDRAKFAFNALSDESSLVLLYIAFLAYDEFCATHRKDKHLTGPQPPGVETATLDEHAEKLVGIAKRIVGGILAEVGKDYDVDGEREEWDAIVKRLTEYCVEITRAGGAELHNIASLAGGMIAQEVIKVVTKQYIPVDNTCVFDGVKSISEVLRL
jgi:amyloid beta precursor protein binding protein 1